MAGSRGNRAGAGMAMLLLRVDTLSHSQKTFLENTLRHGMAIPMPPEHSWTHFRILKNWFCYTISSVLVCLFKTIK